MYAATANICIHAAIIAITHAATTAITHAVRAIIHAVILDESFLQVNQPCGVTVPHDELRSLYLLGLCLLFS